MIFTFLKKVLSLVILFNLVSCSYTAKLTDKLTEQFLPDAEFKTLVVKADAAVHDAEFAKAADLYEKAIIIKPEDLTLKLKQASAYQSNGNLAQAYNSYQVILEANVPSDAVNDEIKKTAKMNQSKLGFKPEVITVLQESPAVVLAPAPVPAKEETPPAVELVKSAQAVKSLEVRPYEAAKAAVQEVAPVQGSEAPPPIISDKSNAAIAVLVGWSDAWMSKNLELYFSYYVNDFAGQFPDAKSWRQSRKSKILNAQKINIEITDIQFANRNDDIIEVSFIQHYQSGNYKDSGRKVLFMKKIQGRWRISQEVFK